MTARASSRFTEASQAAEAWAGLGGVEGVLEAFVDFEMEVSVVAARGMDGSFAHYGVMENIHERHILDITLSPGRVPAAVEKRRR
jgi:5-(carboxyamino)imidazole ribonucleotide synthase